MRLQGLEGWHLDEVGLAEGAVRDDEEVAARLERCVAVHHIRRHFDALADLGDDFEHATVEIFEGPANFTPEGPNLLASDFVVLVGADGACRNIPDHVDAQATDVLLVGADLRLPPLEEFTVESFELLVEG